MGEIRRFATVALAAGLTLTGVACGADSNDGRVTTPTTITRSETTIPAEHAFRPGEPVVFGQLVSTYVNTDINPTFWKNMKARLYGEPKDAAQYFTIHRSTSHDHGTQQQADFTYRADDGAEFYMNYGAPTGNTTSAIISMRLITPSGQGWNSAEPFSGLPAGLDKARWVRQNDGARSRSYNSRPSGILIDESSHVNSGSNSHAITIYIRDGAQRGLPTLPA